MRRTVILISLLILLLVPFLTSCDSGDLQVLVNYAKMWALVHGIMDPDGGVDSGAAARYVVGNAFGAFTSTGDEEGDAVIDSARTIKKIRYAENEATQGWNDLYSWKNVPKVVLPHYNNAVNTRPDDYTYLNERGIAHLMDLNTYDAERDADKDFIKAGDMTLAHPAIYVGMYKQRAAKLEQLIQHCDEAIHGVPRRLYVHLSETYQVLYQQTGWAQYKQLQQQVDTKIKEYQ